MTCPLFFFLYIYISTKYSSTHKIFLALPFSGASSPGKWKSGPGVATGIMGPERTFAREKFPGCQQPFGIPDALEQNPVISEIRAHNSIRTCLFHPLPHIIPGIRSVNRTPPYLYLYQLAYFTHVKPKIPTRHTRSLIYSISYLISRQSFRRC